MDATQIIALCMFAFVVWIPLKMAWNAYRRRFHGVVIDNSAYLPKRAPPPPMMRSPMTFGRALIMVAQAAVVIGLTALFHATRQDPRPNETLIIFWVYAALVAFVTACFTRLWDLFARRRSGARASFGEVRQAGSERLSAAATGHLIRKSAEQRLCGRIGEDPR